MRGGAFLITARGLVRSYGERRAIDGVDCDLAAGECLAVVGPNGAGKSTLLRMLATLLRPDAGTIALCGHELPSAARAARGLIGYLGHDPGVYADLTPWQNLELACDLHGVGQDRIAPLLERVGLGLRAHDRVRELSRGMAQRLGIARMLVNEPRLLLLDEPHQSLDAGGQDLLDAIVRDRGERGVVLVTHDPGRAEALGDRQLRLDRGRIA